MKKARKELEKVRGDGSGVTEDVSSSLIREEDDGALLRWTETQEVIRCLQFAIAYDIMYYV